MVHNRQYILSKTHVSVDSKWKTLLLYNGCYLNYHQNLPVFANSDHSVVLVGDAWSVDNHIQKPQETPLNEIYKQEELWCGRYIIIVGQYILTDTTGNLGVFYTDGVVSSSFSLIRQFLGAKDIIYPPALFQPENADYMPGEFTIDERIKRLLPSLKLDYIKNVVSTRPLLFTKINREIENLDDFGKLFLQNIETMFEYYKGYDVWLPISGGKDSRVCYAALEKLKKNYQVYVYQNPEAKYDGNYPDLGVSRLLCRKTHKKLHIFRGSPSERIENLITEYEIHTSGISAMGVRWLYPCRTLDPLEKADKRVIQLRNNIWELACNDYEYHNKKNTPDKIRERWRGRSEVYEKSIEEWIKLVNRDVVNNDISFADRVYWDLRLGCWLADGMQAFDIYDNIETINILNCRKFLSLLMGLDASTRGTRIFEVQLANNWCPAFSTVPYEEEYSDIRIFIKKWKGKIERKILKIFNNHRRQ